MKKKKEDVKKITVQFRFDEKGKVYFINPSCDEMPAYLFCDVMKKVCEVGKEWNDSIDNKEKE